MDGSAPQGPRRPEFARLDDALSVLREHKDQWARTTAAQRVALLDRIKDGVMSVAEEWAQTAAEHKQIPQGSPLVGEEWITGPYAVMTACNLLMDTLSRMAGRRFLDDVPIRELDNGQIAARVTPGSIWERLLLSGVEAEVWMEPGVTRGNLAEHTASAYATEPSRREGAVALVLGAGNIAAIAPLDCFQKLFGEHQVVLLKMNPVNDYLTPMLEAALAPLIEFGALRIVRGGAEVGEYLCRHPHVDEIHITGAESTHDAIVWGTGEQAARNRAEGTPQIAKRITSELGGVCPTIVVPGPWTPADLRFQAEQIATQKLHNSGFNCVACQVLVLPGDWERTDALLAELRLVMHEAPPRGLYYPGAQDRMTSFAHHAGEGGDVAHFERPSASPCVIAHLAGGDEWMEHNEVFAPAMSTHRIGGTDPEAYLRDAIAYANDRLHGTLGANILVHPDTIQQIGERTFERLVSELRYGCIAINAWTGVAFLLPQCVWGAFPGHTLEDAQSGIGFVHNTLMFDRPQRTVVRAPFRPFPRTVASGGRTLLPRPPWFVTNTQQHRVGELLTRFQYRPGWSKLPRIFAHALRG